jgi:serine/threonine protein kinase
MRPGLIPEDYICIIIRELLMGLEYLHGDKKLHRDIKGARTWLVSGTVTDFHQPPTYFWLQTVK